MAFAKASRTKRQLPTPADAPSPSLPGPKQEIRQQRLERIAVRAHEIYEARGGEHGQELEDWLQAEREIDAETEPPIDEEE
jgi:hypothetical protein